MYSIPMALVDFIPVLCFGAAVLLFMKNLYNKMSKGAFALYAAGVIDVFEAGFLKALYKLLYAAGICNFDKLSQMFFPVQAIGFILAGTGALCMLIFPQKEKDSVVKAVAWPALLSIFLASGPDILSPDVQPPLETGTGLFVVFMVLGVIALSTVYSILAVRQKKSATIVLFVLSALCSLMMGYLSSRDFTEDYFNWIAEGINVIGQGALLAGSLILNKSGLKDLSLAK